MNARDDDFARTADTGPGSAYRRNQEVIAAWEQRKIREAAHATTWDDLPDDQVVTVTYHGIPYGQHTVGELRFWQRAGEAMLSDALAAMEDG